MQVRLLGDKTPSAAARQTFGRFATATSVPTRHSPSMREMSVSEQRYKAVLAVIADGRTVSEVAGQWGVCRQTMHRWLARYEGDGLEGLGNRSSRPAHCPHQTPPAVEAMVLEVRRSHPYWGSGRIAFELARKAVEAAPSESAVYRCLVRAAVLDPISRRRRRESWKRWERAAPMELWQPDTVHGYLLADGTSAKALTGIDDHSRYCVSVRLMTRKRTQPCATDLVQRWGSISHWRGALPQAPAAVRDCAFDH